ncbi:MAG: SDR family oxidoreductase [Candidatus Cloacimonetes bacterium]|nr:SDR family oxidoreductase [Candidatus Cloacimonadota bacterium]
MNNPFSLEGKVIFITGASSGIGRQCAISCSTMGANVILVARNEDRLLSTYNKLNSKNNLYYIQDITEYSRIKIIIDDSISKVGKIDGFIHSAGIEKTLPLKLMTPNIYKDIFNINIISGFEIARILANKKYRNNGASFVFIASIMSVLGQTGKVGYCSSKGALVSGIKAMALELAKKKIRVNSISPAIVETNMTKKLFENIPPESGKEILNMHPLGIGNSEDIALACVYLLSDASRWVTGSNLIIDGGYSAQ